MAPHVVLYRRRIWDRAKNTTNSMTLMTQLQRRKQKRTADYEKKRRRAERILEQARLRDMLGFDIDYQD